MLWLQNAVAEGRLMVSKTCGMTKPADVLTKLQARSDMKDKLMGINVEVDEKARAIHRFRWADLEGDRSEPYASWGA